MTDHVARMVCGWLESHRPLAQRENRAETRAVASLVDAIHRLIREAENETRRRCEELAQRERESEPMPERKRA